MKHLMLDIETMGQHPGCAVLSIGAVAFDPKDGRIGAEFYCEISLKSCQAQGLKIEADTLLWWLKQNAKARKKISGGGNIGYQLGAFSLWFQEVFDSPADVKVYGNSARFDFGILSEAYKACGLPVPWNTWNEKCYRTIYKMKPEAAKDIAFQGVKHSPIDDCIFQIDRLWKVGKALRISKYL